MRLATREGVLEARCETGDLPNAFAGRTAPVTGAASGPGRSLAVKLACAGCDLVVVDVNGRGLRETAGMVGRSGSRCMERVVDVGNREQMEGLARGVLRE